MRWGWLFLSHIFTTCNLFLRDLVSLTKNNFPVEFDNVSTPTGRTYALCNHILAILNLYGTK
jgi:hypothetical protein